MIKNARLIENPNPRAPLAAVLSFDLDSRIEVRAVVSDVDRSFEIGFGLLGPGNMELPVLGMRPDRDHRVTVLAGEASAALPVYRTSPLPGGHGFPPELRVNIERRELREPGIILLSVHRLPTGRYHQWSSGKAAFGFFSGASS